MTMGVDDDGDDYDDKDHDESDSDGNFEYYFTRCWLCMTMNIEEMMICWPMTPMIILTFITPSIIIN